MPLIDFSHILEDGMITYKGLPAPLICDYLSREASRDFYEGGAEFQIGKIEMVANTGTYLDVPSHRYAAGKDLSEFPLDRMAHLEAVVVRVVNSRNPAIGETPFQGLDLSGKAVLVHTGWDQHWRTDAYFEGHPFLTAEAAQYLLAAGAKLVGIDSHNIDDTSGGWRPVHSILLGAEIPIVEHMCNLASAPDSDFLFTAAPPKVVGMGTFPVRAFGYG